MTAVETEPTRPSRWTVPVLGLAALAIFCALYAWRPGIYFAVLNFIGIAPFKAPFFDLEYVLAATECWRHGIVVYIADPCDLAGRPWIYSPLWLRLWFLPPPAATGAVGLALAGAFFASLALLPPRNRPSQWILAAAVLSPTVAYATERANVDLFIFLLVLVAGLLATNRSPIRFAGYAVLFVAGLLKFYPLAALIAIARERPRVFAALALGVSAIVAVFVSTFWRELRAAAPNIPTGNPFGDMFGASNLPLGIGDMLSAPAVGLPLAAVLVVLSVAAIYRLARWHAFRAAFAALPVLTAMYLAFGATLVVGCFLAGRSQGYRAIDLLFVLPGFGAMAMTHDRALRRFATGTGWAVMAAMWQGFFTWRGAVPQFLATLRPPLGDKLWNVLWFLRELTWWCLATVLAAAIVCFLLDSAMARALRDRHKGGVRRA